MPNSPIHPLTDPELIALGDFLKELKERAFYGKLTIHFANGVAQQTTTEETRKVLDSNQLDFKSIGAAERKTPT